MALMRTACFVTMAVAILTPPAPAHADPAPPAFPGAQGFGASASGGRGGEVVYVTNLDNDGPGSLRHALSGGDRTVMFKVSGTIRLDERIEIHDDNITIAGASAPGGGICLRGKELMIQGDNIIVRFMRLRPGDELGEEHDALTIWDAHDVIIDHCSMSWSTDSINDVVKGSYNVSVQWCILSEALNQSVHEKGAHGYGTGWSHGSYHHNLIAHCASRVPRLAALPTRGIADVRNNVFYNWGFGWAYGGENTDINLINNHYIPGPDSEHNDCFFNVWEDTCRIYLEGNVMEGNDALNADNREGIITEGVAFEDRVITLEHVLLDHAILTSAPVATRSAAEAYEAVLAGAGAVMPRRDAVDRRVVATVRDRSGRIIDSQADVGGWPELRSAQAPLDSDGDGMPDAWERKHGLDPDDPADGRSIAEGGYSHLEHYLHSLAAPAWERAAEAGE